MNQALADAARTLGLADPAQEPLRLAFGLACVSRVEHLLEEPRAIACVSVLRRFVAGGVGRPILEESAQEIAAIANSHRGSNSIDGSAHAAVSATYAAANALAGRALEAASYAAYAAVYAYGGYAVRDPSSFEPEFEWQTATLKTLAKNAAAPGAKA